MITMRMNCLAVGMIFLASMALADDAQNLIAPNATPVKLVGDCLFTEGPAYSPKGFLLFSDIPNSRIVRVDADGKVSDFLKPSGNANGLIFDAAGHLYACQGGDRRVVRIGIADQKIEPLCETYDGKPLNSPNDLALDGHGGLYFTDPRYGKDMKIDQPCMGVYYIDAHGKTTRVIDSLQRPNGILVSNDGKSLIVAEPNKRQIVKYAISSPGKLGPGSTIFTGDETTDGNGPDGMCLDQHGNIYATYKGIVVLNPDGSLITRIATPEQPANCTFGGADGKTLYITAKTSVYTLAMKVAGPPLFPSGPNPSARVSRRGEFRAPARLAQDKKESETKEIAVDAIKLKVPGSWTVEKPASNMRKAQFKLPAAEGEKQATELYVASFGGDGGGIDANLKRWNDQFSSEGRKIEIKAGECPQGKYYISDITGTYLQSSGGPFSGKKTPMPGFRSISAILQVPNEGAYFIRLTGPEKSVKAAAESFRKSFDADATKEEKYEIQ